MQKITIQCEHRKEVGKGVARRLRHSGKIPAVIYSDGNSTPLTLNRDEIEKVLHSASGENTLITLHIKGEKDGTSGAGEHVAILRDFQKDPITGKIQHADLFEVSMTESISVWVPVEVTGGIPVGVKKEGGVLQNNIRELEIRCLPSLIPDHIQVDASSLEVGQSIHVKDIFPKEGVAIMADPDHVVVSVTAPISEEQLESMTTTTPEEGKEPELVEKTEGKEESKEEAKGDTKNK